MYELIDDKKNSVFTVIHKDYNKEWNTMWPVETIPYSMSYTKQNKKERKKIMEWYLSEVNKVKK